MGFLPYEKKRGILHYLNSADMTDIAGNFIKKIDWLNRNEIKSGLKKIGLGNVGRDEISIWLDECYNHEKKFVDRRDAVREPKAKYEYQITDTGKNLLKDMQNPDMDFINKRIKD